MQTILEKFPKWRFEIERLYLESTDFRELCQDYAEVRVLVAVWADSDDVNQDTIDEYQALLRDLENEIIEDLDVRFGTVEQPNQNASSRVPAFGEQEDDEQA